MTTTRETVWLLTAADVMTSPPLAVQEDTLLVDAVGMMVERHLRHLPVVDLHSAVVGMLSDRDVRTAVGDPRDYAGACSASPAQYRVRDVMTHPAVTAPLDQPLAELARRFTDDHLGAVPVVDRDGVLAGIVSSVDVLRALARQRE